MIEFFNILRYFVFSNRMQVPDTQFPSVDY